MNILIILDGRYPSPDATSKRLNCYMRALASAGHKVEILPIYLYPKTYLHVLMNVFVKPIVVLWRVFRRINNFTTVFIYGFGWISNLAILFVCKLKRKSVAIEVNEKPYSIKGSRRDYILKYFNPVHDFFLTRIVYTLIDGFIVISDPLFQYISKYSKRKSLILKVPILVDFDYYQQLTIKPPLLDPYILHTATLNDHKDGLSNVFLAFAKVVSNRKIGLHFYLTSQNGMRHIKEKINEIIDKNNLEDYVHFLGDLDEESLFHAQSHCQMVIINKTDSVQNRYNFATKLGEYLALGKPVITSKIGEVQDYLNHDQSCLFVNPSDSDDIALAIEKLLDNPDMAMQIGMCGRQVAQNSFDYKIYESALSTFFNQLPKRI